MDIKITKLDQRHKGKGRFESFVRTKSLVEFLEWRDWAFDNLGRGIERDYAFANPDVKWSWTSGSGQELRIYFKSSQELNWFKMRWL